MKLVELLDKAMKTGDILYCKDYRRGIRYNARTGQFVWCSLNSGEFDYNIVWKYGFDSCEDDVVVLTSTLLNSDKWRLFSYKQTVKKYKESLKR